MQAQLSNENWDYLRLNLLKDNPILLDDVSIIEEMEGVKKILFQDDIAEEIREWAIDRLNNVGFDNNYDLTPEGRILENLVDSLFQ